MEGDKVGAVLIAGSAGSFEVLINLLQAVPANIAIPIVLVLHRQKNVTSDMDRILATHANGHQITEPVDKQPIEPGIYLAPQNYHLLFEADGTFSLDYSEPVHYCRPSIDVTFESAAAVYGRHTLAILLSGANSDGAAGVAAIGSAGGMVFVQDPATASYPVMPRSAIDIYPNVSAMAPQLLVVTLRNILLNLNA